MSYRCVCVCTRGDEPLIRGFQRGSSEGLTAHCTECVVVTQYQGSQGSQVRPSVGVTKTAVEELAVGAPQ